MSTFDKESKLSERRAERQRQMRLMEEAASGLPLSTDTPPSSSPSSYPSDILGGPPGSGLLPPTMADIENSQFAIDDDDAANGGGGDGSDDDDDGPPSVFTDPRKRSPATDASAHLWRSTDSASQLDDEKFGFFSGGSSGGGGGIMDIAARIEGGRHEESRNLIAAARGRLSSRGRNGTDSNNNYNIRRSFNLSGGDDADDGSGEDFRQRSGGRYVRLPHWCMVYRREILVSAMIVFLVGMLVMAVAPNPGTKFKNYGGKGGGEAAPWHGKGDSSNDNKPYDNAKFDRIKDRILEHGISHARYLEDVNTPQHKALMWLVRDDPQQLDVPIYGDDGGGSSGATGDELDAEGALFQRYALAVFWYQTNDLEVVKESMTGPDVDDPFDEPFNPLTLTQSDIEWKRSANWMSEKGLCLWEGIACHEMYGRPQKNYNGDFYVSALNVTGNNVHGVMPREVYTALTRLNALDVSANVLEGTIGSELGYLIELEDLYLHGNDFSGALPDEFANLRSLYNLYLNDNKFRGKLPDLGAIPSLRAVSVFNNTFTGSVPESIGNLKDCVALYLDENELAGPIPKSLGLMTSLVDLRLRDNMLTGTIPTELGNMKNLETIYLDTNLGVTGTIPTQLAHLIKLSELQLYDMDLTGTLPPDLGLLSGLVYLYLDGNDLSGPIPDEWGELHDLEQLFLTGNSLDGSLPRTIRGLTSLRILRAADNELTGPIPTDLGKLTKLEDVYLEDNNFSGRIPPELGELTKLKLMRLHDTKLSGEMPDRICNLKQRFALQELTADCDEISPCNCCECNGGDR